MNKTKTHIFVSTLVLAAIVIFAMFSGCVSDDTTAQAEKLEGDGYTVTTLEYTYWPDSTWLIEGEKKSGNKTDYVRIIYFSSEDSAIEHYNTVIAQGKKDLEQERPDLAEDFDSLQVSNMVIYGTTQGVADAIS